MVTEHSTLFHAEDMTPLLLEHTSGGCNILHVLSLLGQPANPARSSSSSLERRGVAARTTPRGGVLREIMKHAVALASGAAPLPSAGEPEWALVGIEMVRIFLSPPVPPRPSRPCSLDQ